MENEIRKCFGCGIETIFESNEELNLEETEFCHYCDNVFCLDCMDFSEEENICKGCSQDKSVVLVIYREDKRVVYSSLEEAEMEAKYLERFDDCYTRIEEN